MSDNDHDELVSADLDGETTAEEHARIERDPRLRQRRAELAAARDALRGDVPVLDDAAREALLARVLATEQHEANRPATVTPLAARRDRRVRASRVVAIAAAVLAVAFLGGAIAMLDFEGNGGDQDASTAAEPANDDAGAATAAAGEAATSALPPAIDATSDLVDLGEVATEDELRAALDRTLSAFAAEADAGAEGQRSEADNSSSTLTASPCELPPGAVPFRATLAGEPVFVFVTGTEVSVVRDGTCDEVMHFTR